MKRLIAGCFSFVFSFLYIQAQELPGKLKLNQIQIIGSHNSYKQRIDTALFAMLMKRDSARFASLDYVHIPLDQQLDLGLRLLEIDVYADTRGGRYMHPVGLKMIAGKTTPYDTTVMKENGFKVLHVQDIDFRSSCARLKDCLGILKRWSDGHPGHLPIFISFNTKMDTIAFPGFAMPEPFTGEVFDALDQEFITGLGRNKLWIPDDLRGKKKDLPTVLKERGWPTLDETKGKFILILDEKKPVRNIYLNHHEALKGRIMFSVNAEPQEPDAAFMIINDAERSFNKIRELVNLGFIVRTRADSDTKEARINNYRNFERAKESGAQLISTDYYNRSGTFASDYQVYFDGKTYFRVNPLLDK